MLIISLILVLLVQLLFPSAQALDYFTNCTDSPYYVQDSQYRKNLDILLADLTSQASLSGLHYSSIGQTPDQVYGLFLCRGDIGSQGCNKCVYRAQGSILKECPTTIWAVQWYDDCMLRFSNEPFYHDMDDAPSYVAWSTQNVPNNETRVLSDVLNRTMIELAPQVANNIVKFGTKVAKVTSSRSLYTLGQCMLDLSVDDCDRCLKIAIAKLLVRSMFGGRVLLPSCNVRFEVYPFYGNNVSTSFLLSATINSTEEVTRGMIYSNRTLSHSQ